jgi:hypothetical protein
MSDDRSKKAKRLQRTANAINKQLRIAKQSVWHNSKLLSQPHRLAKQHALDCGISECLVCHSEKVFNKPTLQEKRFNEGIKVDTQNNCNQSDF